MDFAIDIREIGDVPMHWLRIVLFSMGEVESDKVGATCMPAVRIQKCSYRNSNQERKSMGRWMQNNFADSVY